MAQQDVRYYLNGLLLDLRETTLRCVATDGHRLAMCEAELPAGVQTRKQIILPRKGVLELQRLLEGGEREVELRSDSAICACAARTSVHVKVIEAASRLRRRDPDRADKEVKWNGGLRAAYSALPSFPMRIPGREAGSLTRAAQDRRTIRSRKKPRRKSRRKPALTTWPSDSMSPTCWTPCRHCARSMSSSTCATAIRRR